MDQKNFYSRSMTRTTTKLPCVSNMYGFGSFDEDNEAKPVYGLEEEPQKLGRTPQHQAKELNLKYQGKNPKYHGHVPTDGSAPGHGALRGLALVSSGATNFFLEGNVQAKQMLNEPSRNIVADALRISRTDNWFYYKSLDIPKPPEQNRYSGSGNTAEGTSEHVIFECRALQSKRLRSLGSLEYTEEVLEEVTIVRKISWFCNGLGFGTT
ncbi:hypothetical protein J6590_084615 [Homalodisca vitripennis]|nr:hypothetical protein J6590_084615 [Homalodisca vitripennis]